jgi:hypothetical protein
MDTEKKRPADAGPVVERPVVPATPAARRNSARRMNAARNFPANTCSASRHTQRIAEVLLAGRHRPHMLEDDPQHCGESLAATVEALWKMRTAALRMLAALDKLDEGCKEPGFRGLENGNGVRCGDEAERARKALARLVRGHNVIYPNSCEVSADK